MCAFQELIERVKDFYRFSWQELSGLIVAIIVTGFIFSFRDWGVEQFDLIIGLKNFIFVTFIAAISFIFRLSAQKIYGLSEGHKPEFKVWWTGLLVSLVIAFFSFGKLPLIFAGTMVSSFMVRQRLGEFRYGFSYRINGMIAMFGILGNLILAILFAIGVYAYPESFFFSKGLWLNLIMAFCAVLPLPQLDGLNIFFGSRFLYGVAIFAIALMAVLLLTKTMFGLISAIIIGAIIAIIYVLMGLEK